MITQRTPEWYEIRKGKFTASNFYQLLARSADKCSSISKSALNCIEKAAAELYYDECFDNPDNSFMGIWKFIARLSLCEPLALAKLPTTLNEIIGLLKHPLTDSGLEKLLNDYHKLTK